MSNAIRRIRRASAAEAAANPTNEHGVSAPMAEAPTAPATEQTPAPVAPATTEAKPVPTLDEALATARAANPDRYSRVVRVVSLTKSHTPARVVVRCDCGTEREIATQDLFQVKRCEPCQKRVVRKARRTRVKNRVASLRAQLAEAKAALAQATPATAAVA